MTMMRKEQVMLGFIDSRGKRTKEKGLSPLFSTMDWLSWDGGKVVVASLLNRKDLPSEETVRCGVCNELMSFFYRLPSSRPVLIHHLLSPFVYLYAVAADV